ncbi:MAG: glycosyltransferase family 4 protein [Candidatus Methanoperedens sp.]|nr:glycosyltransferase family 4 protein [Candidatus Methanoperedens sp.]
MTLHVNFITETVLVGLNTTGIVQAWKNLKESLETERVNVDINGNGRYDLIHIHSYGPYAYLKMKTSEVPKVITSHMLPSEMKMLFKGGSMFNTFFEKYMKTFYNSADFMISPSQFALDRLRCMGVTTDADIISNGIFLDRFRNRNGEKFRKKYNLGCDTIVYSVGLLSFRKGLDIFIDAAKALPDLTFVWAGPIAYGKLQVDYEKVSQVIRNKPENVIFTGYYQGDIADVHSAGDIFLFPSPLETQGLVVLEAGACEKPLILRDIGAYRYFPEDSCIKFSNSKEAVIAIEKILSNRTLRKKLSEGALKLAKKNDIKKSAMEVLDVYESLV